MTGTAAEIALLDATDQAAPVRDAEVSTTALVEVAIERIEQLNPVLGAVVTTLHDQARTAVAVGLRQPGGPAAFHLRIERRVCSRRRRAAGAPWRTATTSVVRVARRRLPAGRCALDGFRIDPQQHLRQATQRPGHIAPWSRGRRRCGARRRRGSTRISIARPGSPRRGQTAASAAPCRG